MKLFSLTTLAASALVLSVAFAIPTAAQTSTKKPAVQLAAQTAKPKPAAPKEESKYQIAQRNLTTAIANLEMYLQENPNGKDAPVARIQLKGLKNLLSSDMKVKPVAFDQHDASSKYHQSDLEWYVETVDRQEDKTRVTLVITNTKEAEERSFYGFDESPLILVDNKGDFYAMKESPEVPDNVNKARYFNNKSYSIEWVLQGGRALRLTVDFDPLSPNATGGKILFKDGNRAVPATFSLLNKKQKPADK